MAHISDLTFKLTPKGIHLVRNRYTYHLIAYNEVEDAVLEKGRAVKNWVIIAAFGGLLVTVALFLLYQMSNGLWIGDKNVRLYNVFGHGLIAAIILAGAGVISIYSALKTVPVIQIMTKEKTFDLRIIKNQTKMKEIVDFLNLYGIKIKKSKYSN